MKYPEEPSLGDITLCLVVKHRTGNLANVLHSVNRLVSRMVVLEAVGQGTKTVQHLASEYDADYLHVPPNPDHAFLLNRVLDRVDTIWALFLNQPEVLHLDDQQTLLKILGNTEAIAFDFPIIRLSEPDNHHFETRLIRSDRGIRWQHAIYPTLVDSLQLAGQQLQQPPVTEIMPTVAVVSLGEPRPEERELQEALDSIEEELNRDPKSIRYWYHLAQVARQLQDWPKSHDAVEEGLNVISRQADTAFAEPDAANGLIGMFCEALLSGQFQPDKTVQSLWTIFNNMVSDGRFSLPLGRLLLSTGQRKEAISAQLAAMETFFSQRKYHLSLENGLFRPALFIWEVEAGHGSRALLTSVVNVQTILKPQNFNFQLVLEYVFEQNRDLFARLQQVLQRSLRAKG